MSHIFIRQRGISKFVRQIFQRNIQTTCASFYSKDDRFCVVPSAHNLDPVVGVTIPEFFWSNLHKWGTATAFECGVSGRKYTHDQVYKQSRSFAAALKQHGLKENDVVAILLPNVPEYAAILLGVLEAGVTASPFNPTYTAHEIATQLKNCEAKAIVTLPMFLPQVQEAKAECPSLKSVIVVGEAQPGCHSFFEMAKVNSDGVEFVKGSKIDTLNHTAILPWSSGTTGPPKGVMLTHSNINTNLLQVTQPGYLATKPFTGGNEQDKFIGILPFFHIYGFLLVMAKTLYHGAHTMTLPKFEPKSFIDSVRRHQPNFLHLVPPLISFMANSPDVKTEDLKSIACIMGGAAPIGPVLINRVLEKAGKHFLFTEGYGMTELSPVSHVSPVASNNKKIGSCGVPVPGSLCKVIDVETGEALGPNQPGELCIKGPQLMKGYYKNEKATNETIDANGWLHTGDIGLYDEDKYFFIVDRLKELIKVRGFQVAPSELEDLLRKHPDVADVAVIGVPDERAGELPRAYIVSKGSSPSEESIHKYLETKVSPNKKLKGGVEFVQAIPKAASGKILRRELKKDYLSKHAK